MLVVFTSRCLLEGNKKKDSVVCTLKAALFVNFVFVVVIIDVDDVLSENKRNNVICSSPLSAATMS